MQCMVWYDYHNRDSSCAFILQYEYFMLLLFLYCVLKKKNKKKRRQGFYL